MNSFKRRSYGQTIDTLVDVMASVVEHEEELDIARILNFMDHYRVYIQDYVDKAAWDIPLVEFEAFIINQPLLDAAALLLSHETGEHEVAQVAL